jgi:hypothetical protein
MVKEIPCWWMQATITGSKEGVKDSRNEGACIKECEINGCKFSAMSWIGWHGEIKTNLLNIDSCVLVKEVEPA